MDDIKNDILNAINNDVSILIELIFLIRYNYIISSIELKDKINKIPLKYISIYAKTLSFKKNEENDKNIKNILDLIENFDFSKIQKFLESIINVTCQFFNCKEPITLIFILDQFNTNITNFNLDDFKNNINSLNTKNNIKIIISSSLNNDLVKKGIQNSMNYGIIF